MKLHLPKRLFTALLTAITLAAAPAALTLGSAAWGVDDVDSTQWVSNDTWYVTDAQNALGSINAADTTNTSVFIRATKDDVVRTVGTLTLKNADTLTIAGDWNSATAHFDALTIESLVIGSGEQPGSANLTVGAAQTSGRVTPAQAVTINSITGSVGNLNLGAASTLTLNDSVAVGNLNLGAASTLTLNLKSQVTFVDGSVLTLNDGSDLILNNAGEIEFNSYDAGVGITTTGDKGTVTIGSGTTVKLTNSDQRRDGVAAIDGIIKVLGGGKLRLEGGKSQLGHSSLANATDAVYLKGDSAGNMATMEFATNEAQHLTTNLYLQGYAQVTTEAGITGHLETYDGKITATGTNNYIDAKVQVNRAITVEVTGADDTLELRGYVYDGAKTMTKEGDGTLTFSNAGANKNSLSNYTHNKGITELDTEFSFTSNLTVNAGEVQAKGKTTISGALNLQGGNLAVYGNTTISGNITQTAGTLTIQQGGNLVLDAASFAGDISLLGSGTLTLTGAYNKTADLSFTTGVTELVSFSQVGAGALNLGTVNLTGSAFMMNYEGGAIHATSLGTVAEGMELVYGKGSQLANLGTFNQSLTLNFFDVADQLGTGVNLGLSLGGKTLEEAKALLSVNGLQGDYTLEERGGALYLTSTGTLTSNGWDINWGGRGLAGQAASSTTVTNITESFVNKVSDSDTGPHYYHIKDVFNAGETVSVILSDAGDYSASGVIVGGFATPTNGNAQGAVQRNVWIRANSGSYYGIVGGNLSNNYGGGDAANFTGDTHILVDGATVGIIIGGNLRDGKNPVFTGNSYISVMSGDVTGAIAGAGANAHNATTTFNGDTNIFVYIPLDKTGEIYFDSGANLNVVAGGGIKIRNGAGATVLNGNANVTVDLSAYTGEASNFVKVITGGHYSNLSGHTQTITGDTHVNIIGKEGVTFTQAVVGGSYNTDGAITHTGSSSLNISGGSTFSNAIVGGNYKTSSGNSSITSTSLTISGGTFNGAIAGGSYSTANSTNTVSNSSVTISGGTFSNDIAGGNYSTGASTNNSTSSSVVIDGGTFSVANGQKKVITGGNFAITEASTNTLDSSSVTINAGTFSNYSVIGGTYTDIGSTNTVGSSSVTINGGTFSTNSTGGTGDYPYNHLIVGGSMLGTNKAGTTFTSTSTSVTITGGDIGMDIYGGHVDLESPSGSWTFTATLDNATVTLNGANAKVNNIYGGSFAHRDYDSAVMTQGDVVVDLIAGTVRGNVYAGGRQVHNTDIVTTTTEVRISDSVSFTSASAIVSGGYQIGCTGHSRTNPSSVTGSKTLVFNGASQDRSGITFDSFDTIQVTNKDAVVTLGTLSNFTNLTKTGAGTLTFTRANSDFTGNIIVSGGVLKSGSEQSDAVFGADYKSNKNRTITVQDGAMLDVNGTEAYYHVVLEEGAKIANTSTTAVGTGWKALPWVELEGDATFDAQNQMVMQMGDRDTGTFKLDLNGHTLTKTGSNKLYMKNVGITSGTIQINAGTVQLDTGVTLEDGVQIGMAADTTLTLSVDASLERLNAAGGTVSVSSGKTLTLGSGTANAQKQHSIGTLNAASADVTLGDYATLTLGGGTADAQKQHNIRTLTGANASVTLGNHATLTLGGGGTAETPVTHSIGTLTGGSGSNLHLKESDSTIFNGSITGINAITMDTGVRAQFTNTVNASKVTVNGSVQFDKTLTLSGNLEFSGYADNRAELHAADNSVLVLDLSNGSNAKGTLVLKSEASLTITNAPLEGAGALWMQANTSVQLEDKAWLKWGTMTVTGTGTDANPGVILAGRDTDQTISEATLSFSNINLAVADSANSTVNASLTNSSVTNNGSGTLTVKDGDDLTAVTAAEGNVNVDSEEIRINNITVGAGENRKVSLKGDALVITATDSTKAATMTQKADTQGSLTRLQEDASFTIQDMTLTNTSITAATVNTQVNFDNVTVSGAVVLKNLKVAMSDAQVAAGGSEGSMGTFKGSTTLLSGITMSADSSLTVDLGDLSSYAAMGPGKYDLSITLSGFSMDAYTGDYAGSGLQFAADSWLGELLAQSNNAGVQISITQAEEGAAAAAAGVSSGSTGVSYSTGNVGMVITITGLNVPEPTTATLSLLALAALAGRRRRK